MTARNAPKLLLLSSACIALLLLLSACSKTGPGSKNGLSENNLNGLSESELNAQREKRFGEGNLPLAEAEGMFRDIHFDYDSSVISDMARQNVESNAEVLRQHPSLRVQLEGHTDERGTAEYNLTLGAARARSVRDLLASYGIPASQLETITYGEEVPLDPGHNEAAWANNRRVHFSPIGANQEGH